MVQLTLRRTWTAAAKYAFAACALCAMATPVSAAGDDEALINYFSARLNGSEEAFSQNIPVELSQIEAQQGKTMSINDMREFINPTSIHLKEYFDFIILFDFLTENKRTKDDIGFIIGNDSNRIMKPAPLYSFSKTFDYLEKDYEYFALYA